MSSAKKHNVPPIAKPEEFRALCIKINNPRTSPKYDSSMESPKNTESIRPTGNVPCDD